MPQRSLGRPQSTSISSASSREKRIFIPEDSVKRGREAALSAVSRSAGSHTGAEGRGVVAAAEEAKASSNDGMRWPGVVNVEVRPTPRDAKGAGSGVFNAALDEIGEFESRATKSDKVEKAGVATRPN